jgi:hypothetical protein
MCPKNSPTESRRSTRVPLQITIEVLGATEPMTCTGETVVVNMHGALINCSQQLQPGMKIVVHVYLTGKKSGARVVNVNSENPLHYGIELDHPVNIWGVSLPPDDWHEEHG